MIVHRLLDAFFRTLDAVDAVRDRVDRALGREPRPDPWAVEWPDAEPDLPHHPESEPAPSNGAHAAEAPAEPAPKAKPAPADKPPAAQADAPKSDADSTRPKPVKNKKPGGSRKGSVDRSGKDFDSPRATAIHEHLSAEGTGIITEEADLDGKKVLARVIWALSAADAAGSELGLTTADTSALLHLAADMEVFSTNIGRACRDHSDLIEETEPDGRSKRYRLTAQGRKRAQDIETRAP
jgi:hypothetical protein